MRIPATLCTLLAALPLTGCIYANVREPIAYRSPTPADVGGAANLGAEVKGEACNHVVLWLVAVGEGGYDAAVQDARRGASGALLADVKADTSLFNVLGVYQRQCTVVTGRVAQVASASPTTPPPVAPAAPQ